MSDPNRRPKYYRVNGELKAYWPEDDAEELQEEQKDQSWRFKRKINYPPQGLA